MKKNKLYNEFEILAEKLGLKILNGRGSFDGGICIVNEKKIIVLNKTKPSARANSSSPFDVSRAIAVVITRVR